MEFFELEKKVNEKLALLNEKFSLYVKFLETDEAIKVNQKDEFVLDSLQSIIIAGEFYKHVKSGNIGINQKITIKKSNIDEETGIIKLLDPTNEYTLQDLITLMITISDNSATNEISDFLGSDKIEIYKNDIGMINTKIKQNITTSEDIVILLDKLYKNEIVGSEETLQVLKKQQDKTKIPLLLPKNITIANKTASKPGVMHDVGIVYSKHPYIYVFMSQDQTDKWKTNQVLSECCKYCYEYSEN